MENEKEKREISDETLAEVVGGGVAGGILPNLKEKVINASTDSASEQDRAAIQKDIEQSIAQIDENALLTHNGSDR